MDFKLELVAIPVTDVDRAKEFCAERVGYSPTTITSSVTTSVSSN